MDEFRDIDFGDISKSLSDLYRKLSLLWGRFWRTRPADGEAAPSRGLLPGLAPFSTSKLKVIKKLIKQSHLIEKREFQIFFQNTGSDSWRHGRLWTRNMSPVHVKRPTIIYFFSLLTKYIKSLSFTLTIIGLYSSNGNVYNTDNKNNLMMPASFEHHKVHG